MPRDKATATAGSELDGKQVQFYLPSLALDELDYLCRAQARREGISPKRLRSSVVRTLIRREYLREREEAEHSAGSEK